MYHYKIKKNKKTTHKRVIIWIISLFVLAGIVYALISSHVLQKLFEKKLEKIDEEEAGIVCKENLTFVEASADTCFYFNKDGIIFKDAPITSGSLIIVIRDYSGRNYEIGDKIADKSFIDVVSGINENLYSEVGLKALSFNINVYPVEELKTMTTEGWYILFNLKQDIKSQLLALKVALKEKIKDRTNLQYIDLRIENRIYYK